MATLDALIGPDNPVKTANPTTLAEMLLFTEAELSQYAGRALKLIVIGMDRLARTTRDIAASRR